MYRSNVVKHFRFSGTRGKQRIHKSPSRVHVAACGPDDPGVGRTDHPPEWVMGTAHPSSVLRSRTRDEDLELLVGDLRTAAEACG